MAKSEKAEAPASTPKAKTNWLSMTCRDIEDMAVNSGQELKKYCLGISELASRGFYNSVGVTFSKGSFEGQGSSRIHHPGTVCTVFPMQVEAAMERAKRTWCLLDIRKNREDQEYVYQVLMEVDGTTPKGKHQMKLKPNKKTKKGRQVWSCLADELIVRSMDDGVLSHSSMLQAENEALRARLAELGVEGD